MNVLKFAGIPLESPEALYELKRSVESQGKSCIVVVSASGGIMGRLDEMFHIAMGKGEGFQHAFTAFQSHLEEKVYHSVPENNQKNCLARMAVVFEQLYLTLSCRALLKDRRKEADDFIQVLGERLWMELIYGMLESDMPVYCGNLLLSDQNWGSASLLRKESCERIVRKCRDFSGILIVSCRWAKSQQGCTTILNSAAVAEFSEILEQMFPAQRIENAVA